MSWHRNGTQKQATDRYVLQLQGELSESRLRGRASFLTSIAQLRPNVVTDLWVTVFPEFKRAVLIRFYKETLEGIDLEKYQREKRAEFFSAPQTCGDYVVHLLQQKLSPRYVDTGDPDPVRHEFFCYATASKNGHTTLVEKIHNWSRRSNLDAEWCRDHALAVLRFWLFDKELRWIGVFPHRLRPVQLHGWRMVAAQGETDGLFSRVLVELDIESAPIPQPLKFRAKKDGPDLSFETVWKTAEETEPQFKKNARLDFRIWLAKAELDRLMLLKQEEQSTRLGAKEFDKILAGRNLAGPGVIEEFETALRKYAAEIRDWKRKTKAKYRFGEVANNHQAEHLIWLTLYQVPDSNGVCLTHVQIVEASYALIGSVWSACLVLQYDLVSRALSTLELMYAYVAQRGALNRDSVRNGIKKAARLIDLKLRNPHRNAGRRPGSGDQLLEEN